MQKKGKVLGVWINSFFFFSYLTEGYLKKKQEFQCSVLSIRASVVVSSLTATAEGLNEQEGWREIEVAISK